MSRLPLPPTPADMAPVMAAIRQVQWRALLLMGQGMPQAYTKHKSSVLKLAAASHKGPP